MYSRREVRSTFLPWHLFLGTWRSHGRSFFVWPCKLYCLRSWWMPLGLKHCADRWSCLQHSCQVVQGVHHRSEPDLRRPLVWKVIFILTHTNRRKCLKCLCNSMWFVYMCVCLICLCMLHATPWTSLNSSSIPGFHQNVHLAKVEIDRQPQPQIVLIGNCWVV